MSDLVQVVFLVGTPPYNRDEVATLPARRAEALIESGRAKRTDAEASATKKPAPAAHTKPA